MWSVAAMLYASVLALLFTSNEDFSINTANRAFVAQQAAAILMACCASVAAFASVVPGYSRWVFVLPALGVSTWLATLLASVPSEWSHVKLAGLADRHELLCVPMITLTALPLAAGVDVDAPPRRTAESQGERGPQPARGRRHDERRDVPRQPTSERDRRARVAWINAAGPERSRGLDGSSRPAVVTSRQGGLVALRSTRARRPIGKTSVLGLLSIELKQVPGSILWYVSGTV